MAKKRMFDKALIDTDRFMDLPMSSKALYFLLGMEADDEGFVSYKKVQRIHGGTDDDIKVLDAKNFVIKFPSGVVVITDWKKNNYLDKNRITETEYTIEKENLGLDKGKYFLLNKCLTNVQPVEKSRVENRREEKSIEEKSSSSTKKTERKRSEPRKDIDFLLKSLESLLGIIDETQKGRRQWAKLFLDSKIPEIYQRKHSRPPTSQEAINSTVLIFKLAHESSDKYIQTNSSSLQWVYRNIGKILNNKAVNAPKVAFIS